MPDESAWKLRVVPNKFAVLDPHTSWTKTNGSGPFRAMAGFGRHEVVVETPSHHRPMSEMEGAEVEAILQAYQKREEELRSDPRIKFVLIFKNQGQRAGASLAHPHSQITATSLVPPAVWQKVEKTRAHRAIHDRCMYCDMRDKEAADGIRVVAEGQRFIVLHPFASRMPFETWILPKRHIPTLGGLGRAELNELGALLRNTMRGLAVCLDAPDWSYVLQAAPVQEDREESFLWHIEILPRTTTRAGFELGTGINITTALPEETATILRKEF